MCQGVLVHLAYRAETPYRLLLKRREKAQEFVKGKILLANEVDLSEGITFLNMLDTPDRGASNSGVYQVATRHFGRNVVLKRSLATAFEVEKLNYEIDTFDGKNTNNQAFEDYVLIHAFLGELGYAPKLYGVVLTPEMKQLNGDLNEKHGQIIPATVTVGVLMENMSGAWNMTRSRPEVAPDFVADWSHEKLTTVLRRIKVMESKLHDLKIVASDAQLFISQNKSGEVLIQFGDLDMYRFRRSDNDKEAIHLNGEVDRLVLIWEKNSGKKYSDAEYSQITNQKRRR